MLTRNAPSRLLLVLTTALALQTSACTSELDGKPAAKVNDTKADKKADKKAECSSCTKGKDNAKKCGADCKKACCSKKSECSKKK